jgi:hypothetical protein
MLLSILLTKLKKYISNLKKKKKIFLACRFKIYDFICVGQARPRFLLEKVKRRWLHKVRLRYYQC